MVEHRFEATLWRHDAEAPWHFVTLPAELSDAIAATSEARPFGSIPVRVRVGDTVWETSLFPDRTSNSHVLPIKRAVRDAESLAAGDRVTVRLQPAGGDG